MFSQSRNRHKKNAMIGVVIALNNESVKKTVPMKRRNVMRLVFTDLLGYSTKKPDRVHRYSCKLVLMGVNGC